MVSAVGPAGAGDLGEVVGAGGRLGRFACAKYPDKGEHLLHFAAHNGGLGRVVEGRGAALQVTARLLHSGVSVVVQVAIFDDGALGYVRGMLGFVGGEVAAVLLWGEGGDDCSVVALLGDLGGVAIKPYSIEYCIRNLHISLTQNVPTNFICMPCNPGSRAR